MPTSTPPADPGHLAPGVAAEVASDVAVRVHSVRACDGSLSRAFQFLGKRWNGMLISVLGTGPAGFAELKRVLGISDSVLSDRLTELAGAGLVERTVAAGPPVTVAYTLTDAGQALLPALHSLGEWARHNLDEERCRGEV